MMLKDYPNKWTKIWLYWEGGKWEFTPYKENIPDGAIACEYVKNDDPFQCKVIKTIEEVR